jgi:hypothetical protein
MNGMHRWSLCARVTSPARIERSLRARQRRTKRAWVDSEHLAEQAHEVAVRAIADAVRDRDDFHARTNLADGKLKTQTADVRANGLPGLKWESCAEVTSAATCMARDRCEPQGLANMDPDVSPGAPYDG